MNDSKWRIFATVVVFGSAISSGLSDGLVGPTLPSLAELVSYTASEMAVMFTWRSGFAIVGSLVIGYLLDRFNPAWVFAIAMFLEAVCAIVAPWLYNMVAMSAVFGLCAFFNGGVIGGTYTLTFSLYGKQAGPFVQAVRMFYIGGLGLAPIVAGPFVIDNIAEDDHNTSVTVPSTVQTSTWELTPATINEDFTPSATNRVQFAYMAVALNLVVWSLVSAILGCHRQSWSLNPQGTASPVAKMGKFEVTILVISLLLTVVYGGMDVGVGGLLYTFVTDYLFWPKGDAILINTVYQVVKIAILGVTIFIAMVLHPKWLVSVDTILLLGASVAALASVDLGNDIAVWVCIVLLGIAFANLFVSNMSWLSKRVSISGKVSALFNIAFNGGIMAIPPLMGLGLDNIGIKGFGIMVTACSVACLLLLGLLVLVIVKNKRHTTVPADDLKMDKQLSNEPVMCELSFES